MVLTNRLNLWLCFKHSVPQYLHLEYINYQDRVCKYANMETKFMNINYQHIYSEFYFIFSTHFFFWVLNSLPCGWKSASHFVVWCVCPFSFSFLQPPLSTSFSSSTSTLKHKLWFSFICSVCSFLQILYILHFKGLLKCVDLYLGIPKYFANSLMRTP